MNNSIYPTNPNVMSCSWIVGKLSRFRHQVLMYLILMVLSSMPAQAVTLDVCLTGCTCSAIQEAVDAAASADTITIGPGTYAEIVQVSIPNLIFVGAGSSDTIVDGPLCAFVFDAAAGSASLYKFSKPIGSTC